MYRTFPGLQRPIRQTPMTFERYEDGQSLGVLPYDNGPQLPSHQPTPPPSMTPTTFDQQLHEAKTSRIITPTHAKSRRDAGLPSAPQEYAYPLPTTMTPVQRTGIANNVAYQRALATRKAMVGNARAQGLPMSAPTGGTTTLPNGKVVNQYVDTPTAQAIGGNTGAIYHDTRAGMLALPYTPEFDPQLRLAQEESARKNLTAEADARLSAARASEIENGLPWMDERQRAEIDALVGRNAVLPYDAEHRRLENEGLRQQQQHAGPQAQADLDFRQAQTDRQRAEAERARRPQDRNKDVDRYYSDAMNQSYREFNAAERIGDNAAMSEARDRYMQSRDALNAYREQRLGIGNAGNAGQQQGQATVVRSGIYNGQRVYQYSDGSYRDETGRVLR